MASQPVFLTLCDAGDSRVDVLRSSLRGSLQVIDTYSPELGLLSKLFQVRDYLRSDQSLAEDQIVVFTDAYDVLCINYSPEAMVAEFKSKGKDLIFGAETIFAHHSADVLPFFLETYGDQPAKYLNSGFIIAYKWAYQRMLNYICDNFVKSYMRDSKYNDQRVLSRFMVDNSRLKLLAMGIDSFSALCYTHTYDDNPLNCEALSAYFVHVTWLALDIQAKAYAQIRQYFGL